MCSLVSFEVRYSYHDILHHGICVLFVYRKMLKYPQENGGSRCSSVFPLTVNQMELNYLTYD